jgi:hypothetical protein
MIDDECRTVRGMRIGRGTEIPGENPSQCQSATKPI